MHQVKAFHGTNSIFENFEMKSTGVWFISDRIEAEEYGSEIKEVKLDITNALYLSHEMNAHKGPQFIANNRKEYTLIILPSDRAFAEENIYSEAYHDVYIVFDIARIKNLACVS